ncbi:staygreen family protein [Halobacillus sp. Marseille-Q1614]|uniref:staygreen family protein n=1 Tax=Halobacillus sp. Marseille-Q1614 TaxID=2709134 RepID=UPI00156EC7F7|nr:staygreen family protein [Halobacillus sp. Marseille-Q1614]
MTDFDPQKLSVEFREGVTPTSPIRPRRYTLTHSDYTAELFLTIGPKYAFDKLNPMRDEVLGEWAQTGRSYNYWVYIYVDGEGPFHKDTVTLRNYVFRRELPLALQAIRYGDREFFAAHPGFDTLPIIVYFISVSPQFNKKEFWGTFAKYQYSEE